MISFLTDSPRRIASQGEAYTEALTRLESLRRMVGEMDADTLPVRDMPGQVPSASKAEQIAFAEKMEAAARDGLAAVTAATRIKGRRAHQLADSLRQGGVDLHRLLSL